MTRLCLQKLGAKKLIKIYMRYMLDLKTGHDDAMMRLYLPHYYYCILWDEYTGHRWIHIAKSHWCKSFVICLLLTRIGTKNKRFEWPEILDTLIFEIFLEGLENVVRIANSVWIHNETKQSSGQKPLSSRTAISLTVKCAA